MLISLRQAYANSNALARCHNPYYQILSHILPRRLRRPVSALYAFQLLTGAHFYGGDGDPGSQLTTLDAIEMQLQALAAGESIDNSLFIALADTIHRHHLPLVPLYDLLQARRLDVIKTRYANFGELMGYCRQITTPLGRLMLQIYGTADAKHIGYVDALGTALELVRILNNVQEDYRYRDHIYLPQEEMLRFHITEEHLRTGHTDLNLRRFMDFQLERARRLLKSGSPLGGVLHGRPGLALRLLILGAERIIRIKKQQREEAFFRPQLGIMDGLALSAKACYHGFK